MYHQQISYLAQIVEQLLDPTIVYILSWYQSLLNVYLIPYFVYAYDNLLGIELYIIFYNGGILHVYLYAR